MKIGIFSGSFDPIHIGHAMMVSYLSQFCDLDALWLMPSPINPLKVDSTRTPAEHRLAMCRIVADKCPSVVVSDFEFSLPRPSYTYQTLRELKRSYPEHEFHLIIGSDNWISFRLWRNHDKIVDEFPIIIYPRPGFEVSLPLPPGVSLLEQAPLSVMSSTFVRSVFSRGMSPRYFVDDDVIDYINSYHLYE